jgi:hypothetical protein
MIEYLILGIAVLGLLGILMGLLKILTKKAATLLVNSLAGILILLVLNNYLGWNIAINAATIIVCAIFGIPGIGTLIVLHLMGAI